MFFSLAHVLLRFFPFRMHVLLHFFHLHSRPRPRPHPSPSTSKKYFPYTSNKKSFVSTRNKNYQYKNYFPYQCISVSTSNKKSFPNYICSLRIAMQLHVFQLILKSFLNGFQSWIILKSLDNLRS